MPKLLVCRLPGAYPARNALCIHVSSIDCTSLPWGTVHVPDTEISFIGTGEELAFLWQFETCTVLPNNKLCLFHCR